MEGVDWVMALTGLSVFVAFVFVAWSIRKVIEMMDRNEKSENP